MTGFPIHISYAAQLDSSRFRVARSVRVATYSCDESHGGQARSRSCRCPSQLIEKNKREERYSTEDRRKSESVCAAGLWLVCCWRKKEAGGSVVGERKWRRWRLFAAGCLFDPALNHVSDSASVCLHLRHHSSTLHTHHPINERKKAHKWLLLVKTQLLMIQQIYGLVRISATLGVLRATTCRLGHFVLDASISTSFRLPLNYLLLSLDALRRPKYLTWLMFLPIIPNLTNAGV